MTRRGIGLVVAVLLAVLTSVALPAQVERREQGNLVIEGIPEIPERIVERMFRYQSTRSASFQDWEAAGKGMLIVTRFGETSQVHLVEEPGGARRQLTFFPEPVSGATVCPDPARRGFLFAKDRGGDEAYQIFWFGLDDGSSTLLTDGASRNGSPLWSPRGDRFAFYTTRRNGRDWDIHLQEAKNPGQSRPLLEVGGFWTPADWSPDGRRLLLRRTVSANESSYHILDLASGDLAQIHPTPEKIAYGPACWSGDGRGIYLSSDEGSEFLRLKLYDLESGTFTLLSGEIPWDVAEIEITEKGDSLAFTANEEGTLRLYLLNTATRKVEAVLGLPPGQVAGLGFSADGSRLAMTIESGRTPGDVFSLHLASGALLRWTASEAGGLPTETFVEPELVRYETFDRVEGRPRVISAWYYRPSGPGPHPVIVDIHGGPEAQFQPDFSPITQYYLRELGVAVLAPNVRGSSGFGKSFLLLDNGRLREDSVKDIGALLDWVGRRPELDASRVAVLGGSYGGYMVLAALAAYGDRLKAGVDVVGISSFVTFLENTQDYRKDLRRVEYGDERDPEMRRFLAEISPLSRAGRIDRPLLVVQGLNDPRVPAGEAEQIVAAVRGRGVPVWYLLARDEGHGFRKKGNRDYYNQAVVRFLEKHLLGRQEEGDSVKP